MWREIVSCAACGLLVDPTDPAAVADAISYLLENPLEARDMGRRGREAILSRYNWDSEFDALVGLYRRITTEPRAGDPTTGVKSNGRP